MWRVAVLASLFACSPRKEDAQPSPVATTEPVAAPVAGAPVALVDAAIAPTHDPWRHATPFVEPENAKLVARYLDGYLDLLWLDHIFAEMLATFPGAPATERYFSIRYQWKVPDLDNIERALVRADATAAAPLQGATDTDRAVRAFTTEALAAWPAIRSLSEYYTKQRFVDDEFARGRQEAALVAEAIAKLTPLRKPMVDAVFTGWRAAAGDKADSPRAIVGASFEACLRAAFSIFDAYAVRRATKNARTSPAEEAVIDAAMSACRKGVGAVSGLPGVYQSFAQALRDAAVAFGDTHAGLSIEFADDDLVDLVKAYIHQWPKLPSEPAEKPAER